MPPIDGSENYDEFEIDTDEEFVDEYGDVELFDDQARSENSLSYFAYFIMLALVVLSSSTCCDLTYNMTNGNALRCLLMLVVGWIVIDICLTRVFYCTIIALIIWLRQRHKKMKMRKYL